MDAFMAVQGSIKEQETKFLNIDVDGPIKH